MTRKSKTTRKETVINHWADSRKFWMAENEYVGIVAGRDQTAGEYVISDGVIAPGGFIPEHYHKWEDQTFHVIEGELEARIGDQTVTIGAGATVHCPRGIPHFMRNTGETPARLISYIFPGDWAEAFFAESSHQNETGNRDLKLIEERFGVIYT